MCYSTCYHSDVLNCEGTIYCSIGGLEANCGKEINIKMFSFLILSYFSFFKRSVSRYTFVLMIVLASSPIVQFWYSRSIFSEFEKFRC